MLNRGMVEKPALTVGMQATAASVIISISPALHAVSGNKAVLHRGRLPSIPSALRSLTSKPVQNSSSNHALFKVFSPLAQPGTPLPAVAKESSSRSPFSESPSWSFQGRLPTCPLSPLALQTLGLAQEVCLLTVCP